ncbi:hypothetical protein PoB_003068600 [Plakobranchus ocellatus]|uniref:Uncharacterized protein n=1 Tax=Plakobranchus ocellatus TaxID=259542 RepID=A0AAV3ZYY0_9GAST|nr:hypothetical protein PoB_003068600 [Plakobranchus ocellatus]
MMRPLQQPCITSGSRARVTRGQKLPFQDLGFMCNVSVCGQLLYLYVEEFPKGLICGASLWVGIVLPRMPDAVDVDLDTLQQMFERYEFKSYNALIKRASSRKQKRK